MAVKKNKRTLLRKFSEDGYDYRVYEAETEVYVGRRKIGSIIGMKEQSGRHCFRLAFDSRSEPRTYRGRFYAAQALELIDDLVRESKKQRVPREPTTEAYRNKENSKPDRNVNPPLPCK